jgi:hypothetical protein
MSTTLTINTTGLIGGTTPAASVRIDLQNCANPRISGTGQICPSTVTVYPVNGVATITLFDNTQIQCGTANVGNCACFGTSPFVSYYSFSYIFQEEITAIGSYNLKPGIFNLSQLSPCVGADCICNDVTTNVAVETQIPLGTIDGINRIFLLKFAPTTALWLYLNGVYQTEGVDYTLFGNIITFTTAPHAGAGMIATYIYGNAIPLIATETPSGVVDGTNTVFTLQHIPTGAIMVYVGGVYQTRGVDYTNNGNIITFVIPPDAESIITVEYFFSGPADSIINSISNETPAGTIDGTNTHFTISRIPSFLMIQQNQGLLVPGVGYTISGTNLTFAMAPNIGDVLYATIFS